MKRSLLVGLLLDSRSKFFDFLVEGFFLLLVEKRWVILDLLFFQMLESINWLGDNVNIFWENIIDLISFDINGLPGDFLDTNIKRVVGI